MTDENKRLLKNMYETICSLETSAIAKRDKAITLEEMLSINCEVLDLRGLKYEFDKVLVNLKRKELECSQRN